MQSSALQNNLYSLNKVPEVTMVFWFIKIMATTVGETAADYLAFNLRMGMIWTTFLMTAFLMIALVVQVKTKKYIPGVYWITVVLISIVGTLITDNMVDTMGIALNITTIGFGLALATTFAVWYAQEKTLSIHTIYTKKREIFYWAAILFTFALGTAAGDLFSEQMNLGYATSALIFSAGIGLITIGYFFFRLNSVLAFWLAYILTRPFGASCGDYLSQSHQYGGLGFGATNTSLVFLGIILLLIIYLSAAQNKKYI